MGVRGSFLRGVLLLVGSMATFACTSLLSVGMAKPQVIVRQREHFDCALAALAMVDHVSYADVVKAEKQLGVEPPDALGGTTESDIIAISARLGVRLVPTQGILANDEGILIVWMRPIPDLPDDEGAIHAVYVKDGTIYDPAQPAPEALVMAMQRWAKALTYLRRTN